MKPGSLESTERPWEQEGDQRVSGVNRLPSCARWAAGSRKQKNKVPIKSESQISHK